MTKYNKNFYPDAIFLKGNLISEFFSKKNPNQVLRTMPEFLSHLHPNDQVTKSVTELPTEAIVCTRFVSI